VIGAVLVSVLIDGSLVEGSRSARICDNVVMAPVAPYLRNVADRIEFDEHTGRIVVMRAGRSVSLVIGSRVLRGKTGAVNLPIAPYLRAGEPLIPLAAVARALGVSVAFDGPSKTISMASAPQPLASMVPDAAYTPPAEPLETFTPNPTPAPQVVVSGVPKPRRTPIVLEDGDL
jgi:hypothetical protein